MAMSADLEQALPPALTTSAWSDTPHHKMITNTVLVLSASIPVLLDLIPMIFLLFSRSIQRTVQLFRAPVMIAALVNSSMWLLFTLVEDDSAANKEKSTELFLSYPMMLISNYSLLMLMCYHYNQRGRGILLNAFVLPFTGYVFYASRFGTSLLQQYKGWIGYGGILALVGFHGMTLKDMQKIDGFLDILLTILNIIPTGVLSVATYVVVSKQIHPQQFIKLSAEVGLLCFMLEVFVLLLHCTNPNRGGGGHNQGQNDDNHDQGGGGGQNHDDNNDNHDQGGGVGGGGGGGGGQNHDDDNDNLDQGGGGGGDGAGIQNNGNDAGEDNGQAAQAGQGADGHQGQHLGQVQNEDVEIVIHHNIADNLTGSNDQQSGASTAIADGEIEANSSGYCSVDDDKTASSAIADGEIEAESSAYCSVDDDKTASAAIADGESEADSSCVDDDKTAFLRVIDADVQSNVHVQDDFGKVATKDILQKTSTPSTPVKHTSNGSNTQGVPVVSPPRGLCCGIPRHRRRPQVQHPIA